MVMNIILFIILIILILCTIHHKQHLKHLDDAVMKENEELYYKNEELKDENMRLTHVELNLHNAILHEESNLQNVIRDKDAKEKELHNIIDSITTRTTQSIHTYEQSISSYQDVLEARYREVESEYDNEVKELHNQHESLKVTYANEREKILADLAKIQATREAAITAQLKEQEVKEKSSFYCLTIKQTELDDIETLERIKPKLHNPRILSMLIWSTYFQKPMTTLCNNILGVKTITGIYKITNQKNGLCYIGQSVDISKRWKDHAKCGLGIDAPAGNKLYKDMQDFGIWNFSWELLEECPKEDLNEKEKFYIALYQSKDYGYNTVKGNK